MDNRLNLDDDTLDLAKQQLQEAISYRVSLPTFSELDKLEYNTSWSSWYHRLIHQAQKIQGYLEDYISGGPVHSSLTPLHDAILNQLLMCTVSNTLITQVSIDGVAGLEAFHALKDLCGRPNIMQAMEICDKIVNIPYDGSVPVTEYQQLKLELAEDLLNYTTDPKELLGLFILFGYRQPKLVRHLLKFPMPVSPAPFMAKIPSVFLAADIPLGRAAS